ncbi:hypothetical protein [Cupriavidus sp. UYPR2.512]|uniref:hypothetical protein n=1 Tax=Cupriavidus sp. UYPR2.512 TaxID=1080187 RepID=UPI000370562D|nr:hypothetical protein [Cupriavidus sp. UYPR2.512]UIF87647.1 hypothetical protein KAF44_09455 [Cupriavidus necator]
MGLAKTRGKQLSDIVTAMDHRLGEVKGGHLYAYLAALAAGPTDFSVAAAQARAARRQAEEAAHLQHRIVRFKARFGGVTLASRSGDALYRIDRDAAFVHTVSLAHSGTAPLQDLLPWMQAIERGDLVLATAATEQRMHQAQSAQTTLTRRERVGRAMHQGPHRHRCG